MINLISSKCTFSGDIFNGYWKKLMAIKAVTDLEDHPFHQKTETERLFRLFSLSVPLSPKLDPCDVLALVYFRHSTDHLIA